MIRYALLVLAGCSAPTTQAEPLTPNTTSKAEAPEAPRLDVANPGEGATPAEGTAPKAAPSGPQQALTPDRIREIVRENYEAMSACYVAGLRRDPTLSGTIDVHVAIDENGEVVGADAPKGGKAKKGDERLLDEEVVGCVERAFKKIVFPPTGRGMMTFTYPVVFQVD